MQFKFFAISISWAKTNSFSLRTLHLFTPSSLLPKVFYASNIFFFLFTYCLRTKLGDTVPLGWTSVNTKSIRRWDATFGKKNSVHGVQSHLKFSKISLNFAKSYISPCLSKFCNKKNFTVPFLKYKRLKLKLRVFSAGHRVAMVTYSVKKIIPTRSPMIRHFFDTMTVASTD